MAANFPWIYPVRVAQAIFAIIVLGLTGYVVSWIHWSDTINFMVFNSVWTAFIAVPYLALAPIFFPRLAHRFVIPAVEALTMIFWFAGFVALGVWLPPSEACHWSRCRALQAATVFGAFEWALFLATTVFAAMGALRSGNHSTNSMKPAPHNAVHTGV